jgi:methionine synthase I (cobalamin-dependent)
MSKIDEFLSKKRVLVTDGATGTMLQKAGLPAGAPSERWENPNGIRDLHRSYLEAGSNAVLTDTFGGTRLKLDNNRLGDKVIEINRTAASLAKEMAGDKALVFGDIGPTGKILEPLGPLAYADALKCFSEQAKALIDGDVDAIVIETMSDLNEAKAAIEGVRQVSDIFLVVTMSFDTRGRTMMGVKPAGAASELLTLGVNVIGANCGRTLEETLAAIKEMRQAAPQAMLWAKPNAGLPHMEGGDTIYDVTPEVMAEYALKFEAESVRFFGGCCGSTPAHIQAAANALKH